MYVTLLIAGMHLHINLSVSGSDEGKVPKYPLTKCPYRYMLFWVKNIQINMYLRPSVYTGHSTLYTFILLYIQLNLYLLEVPIISLPIAAIPHYVHKAKPVLYLRPHVHTGHYTYSYTCT